MWLNKLEEKFGRYAIPNLPKIIVLLYAVGFVIANISPRLYSLLELNRNVPHTCSNELPIE